MELYDVLLTFAQAAMVIAGFGGVVITLHDKSNQWNEWDRVEFRSILEIGGLVIFFSILPIVLQSLLDVGNSWRISILLFAVVHASTIINYRLSVDKESIPSSFNRLHIIAAVIILSQLTSGVLGNLGFIQVAHSLGLFWLVMVGGWLFYLLAMGAHLSGLDE
jgi:hypothetical protein